MFPGETRTAGFAGYLERGDPHLTSVGYFKAAAIKETLQTKFRKCS